MTPRNLGTRTIVFDDFSGGEYGRMAPWRAPKNMWSGNNMVVYTTGEIGPRPGVINISPSSGLPTGKVWGFGATPAAGQGYWIMMDNGKVYTWSGAPGSTAYATAGTVGGTPTSPIDWFIDGGQLYLTGYGLTNSYKVDIQTGLGSLPILTALTGSPSGRCIAQYGDRTVIGGITGSLDNRLRFSDAADKNSWPSGNFIDVGDAWSVNALFSQRQHLLIAKQESHFVLTGVPGLNDILRQINTQQAAFQAVAAAVSDKDTVYGWPINENYPYEINGTNQTDLTHLCDWLSYGSPLGPPSLIGVAPIVGKNKGAFFIDTHASAGRGLLYNNKVWTKHTFGMKTGGYTNSRWASGHHAVYICDGGAVGVTPKIYRFDTEQQHPGLTVDPFALPGDATAATLSGNFDLTEFWDPVGQEFHVRTVIVDFRSWGTGSSTTNHFDLQVENTRTYQGSSVMSNTVAFDQASGSSSASGTMQRRIFGFGEQGPGNGFQLHFSNVRGVTIQRIEVIIEPLLRARN